jgi:hypothetical protein
MASCRAVRERQPLGSPDAPMAGQGNGSDWRPTHADGNGIPITELRIAQKSGWEAERSSITIKIITREATAIGRTKKSGRISYASWDRDQFRPLGHDHLCCHRGASDLRVPVNALDCGRRPGLQAAPCLKARSRTSPARGSLPRIRAINGAWQGVHASNQSRWPWGRS